MNDEPQPLEGLSMKTSPTCLIVFFLSLSTEILNEYHSLQLFS